MKTLFIFLSLVSLALFNLSGTSGDWKTIDDHDLYSIQVPDFMEPMTGLNDGASHQFGYVKQSGKEILELYLIVLVETKEEIASYNLDYTFDALTYWNLAKANITNGLKKSKVLTKKLVIEKVNGMNCVRSDISASFGKLKILYHLAVFEGEHAFYQVLTWTILDQKDNFYTDMQRMINSFNEVP